MAKSKRKPTPKGVQVLVNVTFEVSRQVTLPPGIEPGSEAAREFVMAVADGTQGHPAMWPEFTRAQTRAGMLVEWSGTEAWRLVAGEQDDEPFFEVS